MPKSLTEVEQNQECFDRIRRLEKKTFGLTFWQEKVEEIAKAKKSFFKERYAKLIEAKTPESAATDQAQAEADLRFDNALLQAQARAEKDR